MGGQQTPVIFPLPPPYSWDKLTLPPLAFNIYLCIFKAEGFRLKLISSIGKHFTNGKISPACN